MLLKKIIREGTRSNLFIVSHGKLATHPLTDGILPGVTRSVTLNICKAADLDVAESFFKTEAQYAADEVFLTWTVTKVLPLVGIDGKSIGDGTVGPISRRLYDLLRKQALASGPS